MMVMEISLLIWLSEFVAYRHSNIIKVCSGAVSKCEVNLDFCLGAIICLAV